MDSTKRDPVDAALAAAVAALSRTTLRRDDVEKIRDAMTGIGKASRAAVLAERERCAKRVEVEAALAPGAVDGITGGQAKAVGAFLSAKLRADVGAESPPHCELCGGSGFLPWPSEPGVAVCPCGRE